MTLLEKIDKSLVNIEDIIESIVAGHCNRNTNLIYLEKTLVLLNEIKSEIKQTDQTTFE